MNLLYRIVELGQFSRLSGSKPATNIQTDACSRHHRIDRVYPANEIRDAHERMESNASFGKIVLTFA
jgi:Zinc-binding dehydrogenase